MLDYIEDLPDYELIESYYRPGSYHVKCLLIDGIGSIVFFGNADQVKGFLSALLHVQRIYTIKLY